VSKVKWGVLSTAKIAVGKVIPAMQKSEWCDIIAISSRDPQKAQAVAEKLGIPRAYGSYEALLADPEIEAVYIPLPNHLHVPLSIQALQAGKHVLCEKPIALNAAEAEELLKVSRQFPHLKIMEAFMYRFHPQWRTAKRLVQEGIIGELRAIQTLFSYYNDDPQNVRNQADIGGGALLDIGCYAVSLSRFIFNAEPSRVLGTSTIHPQFHTDTLTSGILEFSSGTATFTVSTLMQPYQDVKIFGTKGVIHVTIPFNAPPNHVTYQFLTCGEKDESSLFPMCDQYTLQGDAFSRAILENTPVPTPLEDAVANMKVIDAVVASATQQSWISL
jgi:predicted dehydrogenase